MVWLFSEQQKTITPSVCGEEPMIHEISKSIIVLKPGFNGSGGTIVHWAICLLLFLWFYVKQNNNHWASFKFLRSRFFFFPMLIVGAQ
jgi:predicted membrane protein